MTRLRPFALLVCLAAACGNPTTGVRNDLAGVGDLAATPDAAVTDLAVPPDLTALPDLVPPVDLAPPPDLATGPFCKGTPVAGTCAATFFQSVSQCFQPFGACTIELMNMFDGTLCWASGASLVASFDELAMSSHGVWKAGLKECMTGDVDVSGGSPIFTVQVGNQTLVYDEGTGDTTCLDGSHVNIGPDEGGCQALAGILNPQTNQCQMGKCP